MNHYTLMQIVIPKAFVQKFTHACQTTIDYFITSETLLGKNKIHTLNDLDEVFDLKNNPEFKTIGVRINPYKRMVLYYKNKTDPVLDQGWKDNPNYVDYTGCKTFSKFLELFLDPSNINYNAYTCNALNIAPYVKTTDGKLSINYLLDFDTFTDDIKAIPEFADTTVDYLFEAHAACEGYESLYTESDKAKVAKVFALDIATFDYKFGY